MTNSTADAKKYYGSTTLSGFASALVGDDYHTEHGNRIYHIEHAHFVPVPEGELAQINERFASQSGPYLSLIKKGSDVDDELTSFLDQISDYNAEEAHFRRSSLIIDGTCKWLFQSQEYTDWECTDGGIFACTGPVGSGKSVLAAALVERFYRTESLTRRNVAHYYFDSRLDHVPSVQDVLGAILKQCIKQLRVLANEFPPALISSVRGFSAVARSMLGFSKLTELFEETIACLPNSVFVIDGFDELAEDQVLVLLSVFRRLLPALERTQCKVAFFGREVLGKGIDLDIQLPDVSHLKLIFQVLRNDIELFIHVEMQNLQMQRKVTENVELLDRVKQTLKERGGEMFLWIHLQLLNIWNPRLSKCDADIEDLLDDLPSGLEDTYRWCLKRIEVNEDRAIAIEAFRWVSQANRPLTSRQLREIVSFPADGTFLQESMVLNSCVTQYCANLLVVDAMGRVCFTHRSVRQLLSDSVKLGDQYGEYFLSDDDPECGRLCLRYLSELQSRQQLVVRSQFEIPADFNRNLVRGMTGASKLLKAVSSFHKRARSAPRALPLSVSRTATMNLSVHNYIVNYWLHHTKELRRHADILAVDKIYRSSNPDIWPDMPSNLTQFDQKRYLIRLAVYLDHVPLLQSVDQELIRIGPVMRSSSIEQAFSDNGCGPLHVAAALGHVRILRYLIGDGPNLTQNLAYFDSDGRSPICRAAENEHIETIEFLLKNTPRTTHCRQLGDQKYLWLPAILAALPCSKCFLKMAEYYDESPESLAQAIFAALRNGHSDIARYLRGRGVSVLSLYSFSYPGFDFAISGSLIRLAIQLEDSSLLRNVVEFMGPKGAMNELASMAKDGMLSSSILTGFAQDVVFTLLLNPRIRHNIDIKATDDFYDTIRGYIYDANRGTSLRDRMSAIMLLVDEPQSHKFNDLLRNVLGNIAVIDFQDDYDPRPFTENVRSLDKVPDDILYLLMSNDTFRRYAHCDLGRYTQNIVSSRTALVLLALMVSMSDDKATLENLLRRNKNLLDLVPPVMSQLCQVVWEQIKTDHATEVPSAADEAWVREHSNLLPARTQLTINKTLLDRHVHICQQYRIASYDRCLSILRLYTLAYAVFEISEISDRWKSESDLEKFDKLTESGSDGVIDLNFPCGYIQDANGNWRIKSFIKSALYRWNWRIRRLKGLPYSEADRVYRPTIVVRSSNAWSLYYPNNIQAWYVRHNALRSAMVLDGR